MINTFVIPTDPRRAARLRSVLGKVVHFDGRPLTVGQHILSHQLTHRSHRIRHYARKKTRGEYKRIKPTHEYTVWCVGGSGISVPKLVFDALPHLASKESEQPHNEPEPRRGSLVSLRPF